MCNTKIFTDKAVEQQVKAGLWKTKSNLLCKWNNKLIYVPRDFVTDNITFISCDFADVRAAHVHDVACKYHEIICVNETFENLVLNNILIKYPFDECYTCNDIPKELLSVESISFENANKMFKDLLLSCNENKFKVFLMYLGVNFNLNWWIKMWRGLIKHINLDDIYHKDW